MKSSYISQVFSSVLFSIIFLGSCNKDEVIEVVNPDNGNVERPITSASSPFITKVFEWTPAPGQYINDFGANNFDAEITQEEAANWAFNRLENKSYVSLGAFGGYIITGFDHSVRNTGNYEIGVFGNAFNSAKGGSNEPGILYVMKDENGNGLPDDTWYELIGSDSFTNGTIRNYAVTYYRPTENGQPVKWKDNLGNTGQIDYLGSFHNQPTYYPIWIKSDEYTLYGTCLKAKTIQNPNTGNWENPPFDWGYADNMGLDNISIYGISNCNRFNISDAVDKNGDFVYLDFIDFVKIQTGVCSTAGWLGEVSTEILGILDLNIPL